MVKLKKMQLELIISPTPFLRGPEEALVQRMDLTITNHGTAAEMVIRLQQAGTQVDTALGLVPVGESRHEVYFPVVVQPTETEISLRCDASVSVSQRLMRFPPRRWTVHVVQTSHHDLGYTGLPTDILKMHDRWLSQALDHARAAQANPEDSRFRIFIEAAWSLEHFLQTASSAQTEEMIALLRAGEFEVNALYGNLTTELCSHEEIIRALYPSFRLKRDYGVPIVTAEHNDITGFAWGLSSALVNAGVRLFIPGLPLYYSWGDSTLQSFWDQNAILPNGGPGAFWWRSPSGQKLLVWDNGSGCGGDPRPSLPGLAETLTRLEAQKYPLDILRWPVSGAYSDNAPYNPAFAETIRAWNERWTWPRLVCSTNARFYTDLARRDLSNLPVFHGELPGQDYPVGAMSTAAATAMNRSTHAALHSAETAATCAALSSGQESLTPDPAQALEDAWREMILHDEHTWGFQFPAGPAQKACESEKAGHAYRAAALAHDITAKALASLGAGNTPASPHLLVFNSLGETRNAIVHVPLRSLDNAARVLTPKENGTLQITTLPGRDHLILDPAILAGRFDLIDTTDGKRVPYQIETIQDPAAPLPYAAERLGLGRGTRRLSLFEVPIGITYDLVFMARNVPSCGWKTYRLEPRPTSPRFASVLRRSRRAIENATLRLSIDPDGRISCVDKLSGLELVDQTAPHALGQAIVRDPYGSEHSSRVVRVRASQRGPVAVSLEVDTVAHSHPRIRQVYTLYTDRSYLDLAVYILKDSHPLLETYLAFPFNLPEPSFRYEGNLSTLRPVEDFLPGAHSDRLTVQNWVEISSPRQRLLWSSLDSPVVALSELWDGYISPAHRCLLPDSVKDHRRLDAQDYTHPRIYSLLFANNFGTNFSVTQSGPALFRYRFEFAAVSEVPSPWSWGRDAVTALETAWLPGDPRRSCASMVQVDGAQLLALKPAEDRNGWILRFWNPAPSSCRARIGFHENHLPKSAIHTNLVEEDLENPFEFSNPCEILMKPQEIQTLRIIF